MLTPQLGVTKVCHRHPTSGLPAPRSHEDRSQVDRVPSPDRRPRPQALTNQVPATNVTLRSTFVPTRPHSGPHGPDQPRQSRTQMLDGSTLHRYAVMHRVRHGLDCCSGAALCMLAHGLTSRGGSGGSFGQLSSVTGRGVQLGDCRCSPFGPPPVADVWIPIEPGTVNAFYGKNGAGKTRLVRALADLLCGSAGPSTRTASSCRSTARVTPAGARRTSSSTRTGRTAC